MNKKGGFFTTTAAVLAAMTFSAGVFTACKQTAKITMPDKSYIGAWETDGDDVLTILEIGGTIKFDFSAFRMGGFSGTAKIESDKIVFTDDDGAVSGTLKFTENSILLTIVKSDFPYFESGNEYVFVKADENKTYYGPDEETEETADEAETAESGESGSAKLLKSITEEGDREMYITKFEYDKQKRLVQYFLEYYAADDAYYLQSSKTTTITYADNSVTVEQVDGADKTVSKFAVNGNTITVYDKSFTIDKDGYIVDKEGGAYTYKDGNLIDVSWEYGDSRSYYYDDKKSPFINSNTPKWLIQHFYFASQASKNNVVDDADGRVNYTRTYEYDGDGFPVTATVTSTLYEDCQENCEKTTTKRFTYYGE